jgi:hypothetical protein
LIISFQTRIRVKVSSVKGIRDPEGREGFRIDFVEVRERPPMVMMTPTNVPKEISQVMVQIGQTVQKSMPGANVKEYELHKISITFTAGELESFNLKPYPNQIYEVVITDGNLSFVQV